MHINNNKNKKASESKNRKCGKYADMYGPREIKNGWKRDMIGHRRRVADPDRKRMMEEEWVIEAAATKYAWSAPPDFWRAIFQCQCLDILAV